MIKKSLRTPGGVWAHFQGRTSFIPEVAKFSAGAKGIVGRQHGLIQSPMPGRLLKINCATNQSVHAQETLCIIEAMKMEYSLKAPFDGLVKDIFKQEGQQLILGEKILEIEKNEN